MISLLFYMVDRSLRLDDGPFTISGSFNSCSLMLSHSKLPLCAPDTRHSSGFCLPLSITYATVSSSAALLLSTNYALSKHSSGKVMKLLSYYVLSDVSDGGALGQVACERWKRASEAVGGEVGEDWVDEEGRSLFGELEVGTVAEEFEELK